MRKNYISYRSIPLEEDMDFQTPKYVNIQIDNIYFKLLNTLRFEGIWGEFWPQNYMQVTMAEYGP